VSDISPDALPSAELLLYDRSPEELRTLALAHAQTLMPEANFREASVETNMVDAHALVFSEVVFAINRVPKAVLEDVLTLLDITRDAGAPATTTVLFNLADDDGHTIPAGTRVRLDISGEAWVFALDVDAVAAPTETTATAAATAEVVGATPNGIAAGTAVIPVDQLFFVDSAEIDSEIAAGRDPESDLAWTTRAGQALRQLSQVLVLNGQFTAASLLDPAVFRAFTIDTYDGTGGPPYTDPGHVTVVARGVAGNLSAPQKAALEASLEAKVVAGVDVHIIDPTITSVAVTATVGIKTGFVEADVLAAVETALQGYLSPDTWDWGGTVRRNELISLIDQVSGVDYVATLTAPAADVALSGDGPLADAGALDIQAAA